MFCVGEVRVSSDNRRVHAIMVLRSNDVSAIDQIIIVFDFIAFLAHLKPLSP